MQNPCNLTQIGKRRTVVELEVAAAVVVGTPASKNGRGGVEGSGVKALMAEMKHSCKSAIFQF